MAPSSRGIDALLVAAAVLLQSGSAVWGKMAARSAAGAGLSLYVNVWWAMSIIALVLQAVVWMAALKRLPVSVAYPYMSLSYVLGVLAGWGLFAEPLGPPQIVGTLLITAGVVAVNRSAA